MKIIDFGVNNYRCLSGGIEKNTISFNRSNTIFLFGQNNAGKSTYLKAYKDFYNNTTPDESVFYCCDSKTAIQFEITLYLYPDEVKKIAEGVNKGAYFIDNYLQRDNENGGIVKLRKYWKYEDDKKKIDSTDETFNPATQEWDKKSYGGIGLHGVFQELLPKPIHIVAMPSEAHTEEIINDILSIKAAEFVKSQQNDKEYLHAFEVIKKLKERITDKDQLDRYSETVNQHFQKLFTDRKIRLVPEDPAKQPILSAKNLNVKFEVKFDQLNNDGTKNDKIPDTYNSLGHGALRTAIFSLLLLRDIAHGIENAQNRKEYIVLFEEPELFLHPKLAKTLRDLIYLVSADDQPFQVLCASHSPQMIDLTKPKTSLVRVVRKDNLTQFFQLKDDELFEKEQDGTELTVDEIKYRVHEILRFNPFLCESFYADEVLLVEGDTEAILLRGYLQECENQKKDIFVVNCETVNNIPFYQRVFSRFHIRYHIICDTDDEPNKIHVDDVDNPTVEGSYGIQKSIIKQYLEDKNNPDYKVGLLNFHKVTFEPSHQDESIPEKFRFQGKSNNGKPYDANKYWTERLSGNLNDEEIIKVPIIKHIYEIMKA